MSRFSIKVATMAMSQVTDNETGKVYNCKNKWHNREHSNGKLYRRFYVDITKVEGKKMKDDFTFPWKAEVLENGKLKGTNPVGMTVETDLAGKTSSVPTADMFVQ